MFILNLALNVQITLCFAFKSVATKKTIIIRSVAEVDFTKTDKIKFSAINKASK